MIRPWYWPKEGQPHRTEPFTWISKGTMAASWWPDPPLFETYRREGIKVVVNCTEFDNRRDIPDDFTYYHIQVEDYGVPTEAQINQFLELTNMHQLHNEPIVVHCVAGCGRTGQFIVAWAAHNGVIPETLDPVAWIRSHRPCSLETEEQMEFARQLASRLSIN